MLEWARGRPYGEERPPSFLRLNALALPLRDASVAGVCASGSLLNIPAFAVHGLDVTLTHRDLDKPVIDRPPVDRAPVLVTFADRQMVAEFDTNLGHLRTREGMVLARKNGKLKGKQPKLPEPARRSIRRRYATGEVSLADLATEYSVGRSTIHRIIHAAAPPVPPDGAPVS